MNKRLVTSFIPLFLVTMLCCTFTGYFSGLSLFQLLRIDVLGLIAFFCIVFYIRYRVAEIFNQLSTTVALCAGIILISVLMVFTNSLSIAPIWIFGSVFIAKRVEVGLALIITYLTALLELMCTGQNFIEVFLPLLVCTLMCVLSGYIHSFMTSFYVFIISVSMQIIILLAWNNFEASILLSKNTIIYILTVASISFLIFFVDYILSIIISSYRTVNKTYFEQNDEGALAPGDILVSAAYEAKAEEKKIIKRLNQIKSEYNTLEVQNRNLREKRISLQDDIDRLELQAASYNENAPAARKEVEAMRAELSELKLQIERAQSDYLLVKNETSQLETQNNALKREGNSLKAEISRLKGLKASSGAQTTGFEAGTPSASRTASRAAGIPEVITSNDIITRLKNELPKVYKYNIRLSQIVTRAARATGTNIRYCYAAALYHDTARLYGGMDKSDFSEAVFDTFPTEYTNVIIQANDIRRQPSIKETGIVLITDDIIKMLKYLKSKEMAYDFDKVVDNVIRVRKSRGMTELCDFSQEELKKLAEFYSRIREELTA